VCGGELTGILSHSVNCGKDNKPSVYVSMASHREWLEAIIGSSATISSSNSFTLLAMLAGFVTVWCSRI
jgi:hypothetical protein